MSKQIIEQIDKKPRSQQAHVDLISMLLNNKRSENTKRAYLYDINDFFTYISGEKANSLNIEQFLSLSRKEALQIVFEYKNWLISERKLSEATINRRISAIRSLANLANTLGFCDYDLSEVTHETVQPYRDTTGIELDQFKQMLQVPNRKTLKGKRDYAILLLLFETALRRGEVTTITLKDYHPENRTIWIIGKGRGTQKEQITISEQLVRMINDYLTKRKEYEKLKETSPLFATTDRRTAGSKMSGEAIRRVVRDVARKAGINKPMSPHRLRHSAITIALDETNGDVRSVQKLSRHKKIDTLLIYDDNRQDKQGEITDLLSSLV